MSLEILADNKLLCGNNVFNSNFMFLVNSEKIVV